ncbi:hypothetical protein CCHR01_17234 [Colletotrichum chrysophilum]|uniref:Uncharacterized protein n=1 Tax=Colletotrichum chrysophilum TaxID=1836956 RepID=A0AAD9A6Y7_9PEZI|nr:hypothetical protein CCHR01_17234 [Colletotrichum chrysophilum]
MGERDAPTRSTDQENVPEVMVLGILSSACCCCRHHQAKAARDQRRLPLFCGVFLGVEGARRPRPKKVGESTFQVPTWSERQSTPSPKLSCTVLDTTPKSARDDGFFGDCQRKVFARRDHLNVTSSSSDSSIIKTDTTTTFFIPQKHRSQSRMPWYMT